MNVFDTIPKVKTVCWASRYAELVLFDSMGLTDNLNGINNRWHGKSFPFQMNRCQNELLFCCFFRAYIIRIDRHSAVSIVNTHTIHNSFRRILNELNWMPFNEWSTQKRFVSCKYSKHFQCDNLWDNEAAQDNVINLRHRKATWTAFECLAACAHTLHTHYNAIAWNYDAKTQQNGLFL